MESSIEITNTGEIYCNYLPASVVIDFLKTFASTAEKNDYYYIKMNEGMVQPQNKEIVISFGIKVNNSGFDITNLLSSMDFEDVKSFISNGLGVK